MARKYPDELLADMQQTYGVNLWVMGLDRSNTSTEVLRAAALAYQLPNDSRVKRAIDPRGANGIDVQLLREIEYNQKLWHWAHTEDAKNKDTAPNRILLPGEEEAFERAVSEAEDHALKVAEKLGVRI